MGSRSSLRGLLPKFSRINAAILVLKNYRSISYRRKCHTYDVIIGLNFKPTGSSPLCGTVLTLGPPFDNPKICDQTSDRDLALSDPHEGVKDVLMTL